jgi:hypothetical protein
LNSFLIIKDNNYLNKIDSLALFNVRDLSGVNKNVVLFNFSGPQKIFYENGASILQYSKLLKKEFLFRNDNLITIREIESKKHALKNS